MVLNKKICGWILFFGTIILVTSTDVSVNNTGNRVTEINITNFINISHEISVPVKLTVNDEINIEHTKTEPQNEDNIEPFENTGSAAKYQETKNINISNYIQDTKDSQNLNTTSCCLVIFPPKCDMKQCVIQRKKMCWNVCTQEIVVLEAPGFSKENFPSAFIPSNWKTGKFEENFTILLNQSSRNIGNSDALSSNGYQYQNTNTANGYLQPTYYWPQTPYPYSSQQNLANPQYQNNVNTNSFYNMPYQSGWPYVYQPRAPGYWCPGPYCPLYMRPYY